MELLVKRKPNNLVTLGNLFIDGVDSGIVTLELKTPIQGETHVQGIHCIPTGKYKIVPRFEGEVLGWMSPKCPELNLQTNGIPWIQNIDGVEYQTWIDRDGVHSDQFVLIHIGNHAVPPTSDTKGCLLVGSAISQNDITGSTVAFKKLYPIILPSMAEGNLTIEYIEV